MRISDLRLDGLQIKSAPHFELAIDWIVESGVQSKYGGFYAWYDGGKKRYSFLYPETTGYAIELFVRLWRITGKQLFLDRAIEAGDWLIRIQRKDGSFYCRYYLEDYGQVSEKYDQSLYAFDAAICLSGLLDLYEATSEVRFLNAALKTGDWHFKLQNPDGSLVAGYHGDRVIKDSHWSRTSSCHHLKNILALLKLYKTTGTDHYLSSAAKLLKWGQILQINSGRFTIYSKSKETYSHAHCYATEGMLFSSRLLNNVINIPPAERAVSSARWLSKMQNDDGSIYNWYYSNHERIKVSDALAQAVCIWIITRRILAKHNLEKAFSENIERGLSFLSKQQCMGNDENSYGGFFYGEQDGKKIEHINTWATFFALRIPMLLKEMNEVSRMIDILF